MIIHPGSILFREKPEFIVAGEIVKTSRMYARSVSPLKKQWIKEISNDLYLNLISGGKFGIGKQKYESQKSFRHKETNRNTTNNLVLGGFSFPISKDRGKKYVRFNWHEIQTAVSSMKWEDIPQFGNLRGELRFEKFIILKDTKVNKIFKAAKLITPQNEIVLDFPTQTFNMNNFSDIEKSLIPIITRLMNLTPVSKKKGSKELGFLSLNTDNNGTFWLKSTKRFNTALNQSMEAIEALANEVKGSLKPNSIRDISAIYGKLNSFYL